MPPKSFNVLFIAPGEISEAVLTSGILKKLYDEAPDPIFTIVASRKVAPLFADMPRVERVIVTDKLRSGRQWYGLFGGLRARSWSLVVDLAAGVITGRLRPKGKPLRREDDEPAHKLIEAAQLMRLEEGPPAPFVFVGPETAARAAKLVAGEGPILAVAPAAEWVGKAWPAERFAEVVRRLMARGAPLEGGRLMILGEREQAHAVEAVRAAAPRDRTLDLMGKTDLVTACAALGHARLYLGNDTGYSQLAAVSGAPTVALFGPSDDRIWRPWGENVRVVRGARNFEEIRRIDAALSAQVRHMIDLSTDSVMAAAEALLEDTEPGPPFAGEPVIDA